MMVKTLEDLKKIKKENYEYVHMRDIAQLPPEEIVDLWIIGGDKLHYEQVSKFIKTVYEYFKDKNIENVRIVYRSLGFENESYDIKINDRGKKYYINDTNIDEVRGKLKEIYGDEK